MEKKFGEQRETEEFGEWSVQVRREPVRRLLFLLKIRFIGEELEK